MRNLQSYLQRACRELNIEIVSPFTLNFPNQKHLKAQALLPEFGAPKGMLIFNSYDELKGMADELVKIGYGYSIIENPLPSEKYDLDSFIEMFSDWGWESSARDS